MSLYKARQLEVQQTQGERQRRNEKKLMYVQDQSGIELGIYDSQTGIPVHKPLSYKSEFDTGHKSVLSHFFWSALLNI